ncbi:PIGF/3-ketodihydrosphingosine reductase fusion protein isoform X3 [Salvia miltiorrhiza]|uniref:PIGF/3-ketodihydrosphingosine reductase fusion protein isoform X3 n=1 Tax=Salvia miltiorrhiza TaxID=226208 RepID=UPI0025ACFA42|nr:PIGF/3-ketodihydrosphingosine reductase fusion protein isoform X3 [Salvia miltiorrhiza]
MQQPLQEGKSPESINATILFASLRVMLLLHLTCGLGLALAFWVAVEFCSLSLIQNPAPTLFIVWAVDALVVIPVFSQFRLNPDKCSYVKAIVRGLMGLPAGALVNALGAIVLGAPVGIHLYQQLLCLAHHGPTGIEYSLTQIQMSRPMRPVDFIICLPAHGAIIGAWFGAWPMPLDWERPWQEWPICVTYGAILGYLIGVMASFGFIVYHHKRQHNAKRD